MQTSLEWRRYFEHNARSLLPIPWHLGNEITKEEREAIASSVQDFQIGESSEGRHLIQYSKDYADQIGDVDYGDATRLFIAEEQRHARDLGHFLQLNGIPLVEKTFTDGVFRQLRKVLGSLEISIAVLVTAEIIAKVYYVALKDATRSQVLDCLCRQILQDEENHVEFQMERLGALRARRAALLLTATMALQRFLYLGTCIVVWRYNRKVFERAGYGLVDYWGGCWDEFEHSFKISYAVIDELNAPEIVVGFLRPLDRE